jgi:cell division protein FtsL
VTISRQFNKRRIFVAEDSINVSREHVSIQQQNLQIEESAQ